jgi:hypothetical protein
MVLKYTISVKNLTNVVALYSVVSFVRVKSRRSWASTMQTTLGCSEFDDKASWEHSKFENKNVIENAPSHCG